MTIVIRAMLRYDKITSICRPTELGDFLINHGVSIAANDQHFLIISTIPVRFERLHPAFFPFIRFAYKKLKLPPLEI